MAAWNPGDPWPPQLGQTVATPGGVALEKWGGYIRFWLLAEIAAGSPFTLGQSANDRLNAGNVLTDAAPAVLSLPTTGGLWVDITCDLVEVEIRNGASTGSGVLTNTEAGTLVATLYDPEGKYDPLNPDTPFAMGGRSRLVPGQRVLAVYETVSNPTAGPVSASQHRVFTGTADSWSEEWTKYPGERRAKLIATDLIKNLVKMDRDEQPPVGNGDTPLSRINRIANYFGFPTATQYGTPDVPRQLGPTTLAQPAWEMLNRVIDDELGFLWIEEETGSPVFTTRELWAAGKADVPGLKLGCGGAGFYDVITTATPSAFDTALVNKAYAARSGGTTQVVANAGSVNKWGEHSATRTDLGLIDDASAAAWAQALVLYSAYPRAALDAVELHPALAPDSWALWPKVLQTAFVFSLVEVVYESPAFGYVVDVLVRVIGYTHSITPDDWVVEWRCTGANLTSSATTFHLGPHPQDRLDADFALA